MRAVIFAGTDRKLELAERPVPELEEGDILLRVAFCGICGSDLHAAREPGFRLQPGQILGHEFAGIVAASRAPGWREGDRACAAPLRPCAACAALGVCRRGQGMLCPDNRVVGLAAGADGAYAEYVRIGAAQAFRLPETLGLAEGALAEPLAVGAHGVRRAGDLLGRCVLIIGAGPIGLTVAIFARIAGAAHVVVSEPNAQRRALAGELGATALLDPRAADFPAQLAGACGGPPDVIFECSGVSGMLRQALKLVAIGGRIVVLGATTAPESFVPMAGLMKEATLHFALGYAPEDFRLVLELMAQRRIDALKLVSRHVALEAVPEMFAALQAPNDWAKILITPN